MTTKAIRNVSLGHRAKRRAKATQVQFNPRDRNQTDSASSRRAHSASSSSGQPINFSNSTHAAGTRPAPEAAAGVPNPNLYAFRRPVSREQIYKGVGSPTNYVDPDMSEYAQAINAAITSNDRQRMMDFLYGHPLYFKLFQKHLDAHPQYSQDTARLLPVAKAHMLSEASEVITRANSTRPRYERDLSDLSPEEAEHYAALKTLRANDMLYDVAAGNNGLDHRIGLPDLIAVARDDSKASGQLKFGAQYFLDHRAEWEKLKGEDDLVERDELQSAIFSLVESQLDDPEAAAALEPQAM